MRTLLSAVFVAVSIVGPAAQTPDSRLTAADVQTIAKVPVHQVSAGQAIGAGPGLNFATPDNKMLLMVNFGTDALYKHAKEQKELKVGSMTVPMPLFNQAIAGIGDEAFDSPPGNVQYVIYLRKGTRSASLSTYFESGTKPRLSLDQLKALAKIVASRL